MSNIPELLAPAGDLTCLHAAVRAGADAVYLGLDRLNARRGAGNFTLDELRGACDWAHVRGVRVYVALNTVVLPSEFDAALELVRQAWRAGADAFIVQDVGLATQMRERFPQARLHVSTQMNAHSADGIAAAAQLGASRVTLARELSLAEVAHLAEVADGFGMQVEAFCHGAICICYSGQCLLSSMVGGRSANRGLCAQACRLPYELHNRAVRKPLPAPGNHLLSPADLCTAELLPQLAEAGVASLKVEGRMKSPEYVFAVTGVYRALLDRLAASGPEAAAPSPDELRTLAEAFSRGFTKGYLAGEDDDRLMSYARPNNRGVFAGRVTFARDGVVRVAPELELEDGDVLEFWTNRGHFAHAISGLARKGREVQFAVPRAVGKGDRVFRVRAAAAAYVDDASQPRVPVDGACRLRIGQPARLELSRGDVRVAAEGDAVEPARTKPVSAVDVRAHIDRFGTTPFALRDLAVDLDEGAGIGFSQLHALRARAADQLQAALLAPWHDRRPERAPRVEREDRRAFQRLDMRVHVVAWATNPACARAARKAGADLVYVPSLNYQRGEALVAGQVSQTVAQAGYPKDAAFALPAVMHDALPGTREHRLEFDPWRPVRPGKPVYADNLGALVAAAQMGALPEAGWHIPVTNAHTANALADLGATRVWLSPELTLGQIQRIGEDAQVPLGVVVRGATELMVCEHCLLSSQGPCDRDCRTCARRRSPHFLRDRKGFELPVFTDCTGRSHLYNAVPLDIVHAVPDLINARCTALMVDATLLNVEQTRESVARVVRARDLAVRTGNSIKKLSDATTGHLFRSVD